ncbi:MAG: UDP-N-acetylenolpyruvoylglucosamine reductase [Candidatus Lumbricidophila eiseniae]|uniref:UDP-N-acetylenolpyruvoylglucosamine reductase n=1 Tax=Candidatus Lumbricidiphila eiseniae TaxID=1969409 RepID=A0A2A6FN20_9MICO|nr:MAG: UDP-N-acetylenolpyruvoylglucosamine reductase [Candidatus Lumbricidophila eiseniae]
MSQCFSESTTLRVGGPMARLLTVRDERELTQHLAQIWQSDEPWFVLGGGSNVLASDEGFDGTVLRLATRGIELVPGAAPGYQRIHVRAGERWDDLVAWTVAHGYVGIEALSGIPGLVGAAPVQNIGAYGQELSTVLSSVDFLDEGSVQPRRILASELGLGYRDSLFKQGWLRGIISAIELDLVPPTDSPTATLSESVAFEQLARALDVPLGERVSLARVRNTVRALRAAKGMLLDPSDPDTASAGSFFTNPIVNEHVARSLPPDAPRWCLDPEPVSEVVPLTPPESPLDAFHAHRASVVTEAAMRDAPSATSRTKLSAAWLIEHSGIHRGFRLPGSRAAISSKHTLALTNRGGATAEEIAQLARYVRTRVHAEFGFELIPEPTLLGVEL